MRYLGLLLVIACSSPPCGPATCAGCCAAGECQAGTTIEHCGFRGAGCIACAPGDTCTTLGTCFGANSCDPANCAGCCARDGTCHIGILDDSCGQNGDTCQVCDVDAGRRCSSSHTCS